MPLKRSLLQLESLYDAFTQLLALLSPEGVHCLAIAAGLVSYRADTLVLVE